MSAATAEKRPAEDVTAAGDEANGAAKKAKADEPFGTVMFSGASDWNNIGRKANMLPKSANTKWKPVRLAALKV